MVLGLGRLQQNSIEVINLNHGTTVYSINGELLFTHSFDGKLLLTRDPIDGGKLSLWSAEDGRLHSIITHDDASYDFFSPNGETMVTTTGLTFTGSSGELVDDWEDVFAHWDDFREEQIDKRNWLLSGECGHGITTESLPGSLCKAPFKWQYLDRQYEMEFVAGFIGFTQSAEDFAVRPKIGWAVGEA